jgi:hypothetical protein
MTSAGSELTVTPDSSKTSRRSAASEDSPDSTKPARVEKKPSVESLALKLKVAHRKLHQKLSP